MIGYKASEVDFNEYIHLLEKKNENPFIAIKSLDNLHFRSRFMVDFKAYNPESRKEELVPHNIFVYPDLEAVKTINNAFTLGIVLKGARMPLYIPLLARRILTQEEKKAVIKINNIKTLNHEAYMEILNDLGIRVDVEKSLANNTFVLRVEDPEVGDFYRLLIDCEYRVRDVDFCIHDFENLFLLEIIILVRENRSVHRIQGFHY